MVPLSVTLVALASCRKSHEPSKPGPSKNSSSLRRPLATPLSFCYLFLSNTHTPRHLLIQGEHHHVLLLHEFACGLLQSFFFFFFSFSNPAFSFFLQSVLGIILEKISYYTRKMRLRYGLTTFSCSCFSSNLIASDAT